MSKPATWRTGLARDDCTRWAACSERHREDNAGPCYGCKKYSEVEVSSMAELARKHA